MSTLERVRLGCVMTQRVKDKMKDKMVSCTHNHVDSIEKRRALPRCH